MQRQHVLRTDFFVSGQNKKLARKTLEKLLHYISSMIRVNTGKWSINNLKLVWSVKEIYRLSLVGSNISYHNALKLTGKFYLLHINLSQKSYGGS